MLYLLLAITQTEKVMSDNLWVSWYYHIRYLNMKLSFKGISIKDVPREIKIRKINKLTQKCSFKTLLINWFFELSFEFQNNMFIVFNDWKSKLSKRWISSTMGTSLSQIKYRKQSLIHISLQEVEKIVVRKFCKGEM